MYVTLCGRCSSTTKLAKVGTWMKVGIIGNNYTVQWFLAVVEIDAETELGNG